MQDAVLRWPLLAFLPWKSPASSRRFDQPVRSVPCGWHCLSCGRPSAGQPDGRRCLAVLALGVFRKEALPSPPPRVTRFGRQAATHASCESCCSLSSICMRSSLSQCSSLASYTFATMATSRPWQREGHRQRPSRGRSGPIRRPGSGFRRICSRGRNVQTHVLGSGTTRDQAPSSDRYFR